MVRTVHHLLKGTEWNMKICIPRTLCIISSIEFAILCYKVQVKQIFHTDSQTGIECSATCLPAPERGEVDLVTLIVYHRRGIYK